MSLPHLQVSCKSDHLMYCVDRVICCVDHVICCVDHVICCVDHVPAVNCSQCKALSKGELQITWKVLYVTVCYCVCVVYIVCKIMLLGKTCCMNNNWIKCLLVNVFSV